ncbi:LysM peptidoglycan-binding domain-containing protein [Odoribacter sp. OttesenSCG-928-G04]|nr:LysM peptidoglycan-binding domain-containing protein [Odoribacter sp. OttesenSCG-928-G04]
MRLLLILFFIAFHLNVFSDNVPVKKSTEIVVIKGTSYYLHTIEEKQTLYSIAKAYQVTVEQIKEANDMKGNTISVLDVLKIPYLEETSEMVSLPEKSGESYGRKDNKYYYHEVEKGETLYSISRRFEIKVRSLLKENPQYEKSSLGIGDIVRLPLKDIVLPEDKIEANVIEPKSGGKKGTSKVKEVNKEIEISEATETVEENKSIEAQEDLPDCTPQTRTYNVIPDSLLSKSKYVKVAVLLPFYARDNFVNKPIVEDDSLGYGMQTINKELLLSKSEQFVFFYEGILLGLDSLKKMGYKIDIHVFDTYRNNTNMYKIAESLNGLNPDIIIGPVYASELKVLVENLQNKQIPIIYPLSSRGGEELAQYGNILQVNISYNSLVDEMTNWVFNQYADSAYIMAIDLHSSAWESDSSSPIIVKDRFSSNLSKESFVQFFNWDFISENPDTLRYFLSGKFENIIVLPTSQEREVSKILPVLSAYTDQFRIRVIGFPEWQNFLSVDHETYYKLNVTYFCYSYINNNEESAKYLAQTYRKYFYTEPHTLTYKAFDIATYFIPLVAVYRSHTLAGLPYNEKEETFSIFKFQPISDRGGFENKGLYMVNYGSDYQVRMTRFSLLLN